MRFYYLSTNNAYPQNRHLIDGLRELGHEVFDVEEKKSGLLKYRNIVRAFWPKRKDVDVIIVGFTSPHFVPLMRLISFKKVIYNACFSQYEANIISRSTSDKTSLGAFIWWLKDYVSFFFSSKILLESGAQIDYVHKLFFIPKRKLARAWAGVNEKEFFPDSSIEKYNTFTVLFRGRFLPESGILTVVKAAKLLEKKGVDFCVIGVGFLHLEYNALMNDLKPENFTLLTQRFSYKDLREQMLRCHLSLGQLADHKRLDRTLPCKMFETLALGLPYLTGRNRGVMELLEEDKTCFAVNTGDANALAEKIMSLKNNPKLMSQVAKNGYRLYRDNLTSKKLAEDFIKNCL